MRPILFLLALCLAAAPPAARAFSPEEVMSGQLRPGWQLPDGGHMTALHIALAPGWKTYWRSPGDAGIPPMFDWSGSENLASVQFHWPRPHVFHLNGLQTVGYKGELVLPIEVTPADPTRPVRLKGSVELGVCDDICLPATLPFDLLVDGPGAPDPVIDAALSDRPIVAAKAGLRSIGCTVDPIDDGLRLTALLDLPPAGEEEVVVFETGTPGIWVSEADTARQGAALSASVEMVPPHGAPFALDRSAVTVTVISKSRAVEIRGCPAP
ncbi:MAG: protein-disulfide reductase DsbD family protein [Rhodobacteraceae bacterium]|nr:protein-disulfide reductase DsbD family protein [Paracoccaceae bacterium]